MSRGEASPARLVLTLSVAGLCSGLVLVGIYLVTLPRIERNRAEALRAAIFRVLPGTERVEAYVVEDGRLSRFESEEGKLPLGDAVYAGYRGDGSLVGYAVPADGPGFMDTIKLLYGYDPGRGVVVGMQVLESRETPGLGDKIVADPQFHENFKALVVEPSIVPVKRGNKHNPNEVDCITGATISSEAVVSILNKSTQHWLPLLHAPDDSSEVSRHVESDRR